MRQFNNSLSRRIGQWSSIDINTAQLIDAAVSGRWAAKQCTLANRCCMSMHYSICNTRRRTEIIFNYNYRCSHLSGKNWVVVLKINEIELHNDILTMLWCSPKPFKNWTSKENQRHDDSIPIYICRWPRRSSFSSVFPFIFLFRHFNVTSTIRLIRLLIDLYFIYRLDVFAENEVQSATAKHILKYKWKPFKCGTRLFSMNVWRTRCPLHMYT